MLILAFAYWDGGRSFTLSRWDRVVNILRATHSILINCSAQCTTIIPNFKASVLPKKVRLPEFRIFVQQGKTSLTWSSD